MQFCLFISNQDVLYIYTYGSFVAFGLLSSNDLIWRSINLKHIFSKCSKAVSMATGMHRDKSSIDSLVFCHHNQNRKVSAKSVTMRATTLCKNLSGYRELLISINHDCEGGIENPSRGSPIGITRLADCSIPSSHS